MSRGSPSPKSPYIMTRISPKSPYIMAAKSPKSPMLHEKYKSGCAWGLISIFNFRQDRSSKRLISDRRGLDRHNTGNRHTRSRHNVLPGVDEKRQFDNDGPNNKTLLLEYAKENVKSFTDKDKSKKHRTERKSSCVSVNGCKDASILGHKQPCRQISVDELLHKLDSSAMASSLQNHHKHGRDNGLDKKDIDSLDSKQLIQTNDLAEAYVNQTFINGKSQSKQVLDALQILNSNKELFLKLLQDPNSLLVKHIEELRDAQAKQVSCDAKLPEHQATDERRSGEPICAKKFWRQNMRAGILKKIKFQESYPPKGVEDHQSSNEIVVLKPGPSSTHITRSYEDSRCTSLRSHYQETEEQSTKHTSFTLGGIRRKLRHAVGVSRKEQQQFSISNRLSSLSEIDSESVMKWKDKIGRTKSFESSNRHGTASISDSGLINSVTVKHHKQSETSIPTEDGKHDPEMPRNEGKICPREGVPKTQGKTLYLHEYDLLHELSPIRDCDYGFASAEMNARSCTIYHKVKENKRLQNEKKDDGLSSPGESLEVPSLNDCKKPIDQMRISESRPNSSESPLSETKALESICMDNVCSTGSQRIAATNNSKHREEINLLEVHSELNDISITYANENINTSNSCRENESLGLSRLDSPPPKSESSTSSLEVSSSDLLSIEKMEGVNIKDGAEQPSPVSVLERFCIEDITSPANIISYSAELPVQPEQICFEEHCSTPLSPQLDCQRTLSTSMNEQGSLIDYVRSVVQAASLDWDELSLKCNFSDQLLEPSIYDEFGVSCSDHGLLFDCINENLLQVYQYYFRSSPWVSIVKPKIRPFSVEEHVVHEVVKCFDCYLLPQPMPQTLERLAGTDLAKSISWMDIHIGAEDTVIDVADGVLDELIMETLSQLQA